MSAAAAVRRLTRRAQFVAVARGRRTGAHAFVLQAAPARENEPGVGFTVTKKVGNAPERNRIKRRLRAAVSACEDKFHAQHDYVLIGRRTALAEPFDALVAGLEKSIARVHSTSPTKRTQRP